MADSDLESRFKRAVWLIRNGPPIKDDRASNETKLQFYSYYKQVLNTVCRRLERPWFDRTVLKQAFACSAQTPAIAWC